MVTPAQVGLLMFSGIAIASGQAFLSVLSRGFSSDLGMMLILRQSLFAWSMWASLLLYGSGMLSMFILLRYLPLAQASVGIWAVTIIANVAFTMVLGQSLNMIQYIGIVFVFVGMILLQTQ